MKSLTVKILLALAVAWIYIGIFVASVYTVQETGMLFMYSDTAGTTILPQDGNIQGYILPATGTTVYVQVQGITEVSSLTSGTIASGETNIILQYNDGVDHNKTISGVPLTNGDTDIIPWVVGDFSDTDASLIEISPCQTGIVFYGISSDEKFLTRSNGGSNGGHFYGPGSIFVDTQCDVPSVPEFDSPGVAVVLGAVGLAATSLFSRRLRKISHLNAI